VLYGTAREFVYDGSFTLSELDWALQPVYFTGVALELETAVGLHASVEVRSGVPGLSGQMTDSDWLNYNPPTSLDARKTNFSEHNCYTERAFLVDTRVGWVISLFEGLEVEPYGKISIMRFKWTARDGYVQYPPEPAPPYTPWTPDQPKQPVFGTGIVYEQNYLIPAVGISARLMFSGAFDAAASLVYAPYVFCDDLDNHEFAGTDYTEKMSKGFMLEPELSLGWRIAERARLSLEVSFRHIAGLIGDSTAMDTTNGANPGQSTTYPDSGGASFDVLSASLSFHISL
jgi:outer membrane protease